LAPVLMLKASDWQSVSKLPMELMSESASALELAMKLMLESASEWVKGTEMHHPCMLLQL